MALNDMQERYLGPRSSSELPVRYTGITHQHFTGKCWAVWFDGALHQYWDDKPKAVDAWIEENARRKGRPVKVKP